MSAISRKIANFRATFTATQFAITINPQDYVQHIADPRMTLSDRFKEVKKHVKKFVNDLMYISTPSGMPYVRSILLYPDLSFPEDLAVLPAKPRYHKRITKAPRCHYHGIFILTEEGKTSMPEFLNTLTYTIFNKGMFNIDTIDNVAEWTAYAKKFIDLYPRYKKYTIAKVNEIDDIDTSDESDEET